MRLELRDIRKSFGDLEVLHGVNLSVEASSLAIIGPSGGGKSTFLRVIAGLIAPDSGTVLFDDKRVDFKEPAISAHRRRLGFVFQSRGLFEHLTSLENVTLPLVHVYGVPKDEANQRARALLDRFDLTSELHKRPHEMSGGQQQRVAIARAVAINPAWLLLDEPTSALDPEYTAEVLKMLQELQETGLRTIIVTHHMGFARHACEQVAFMADGMMVEVGEAEQIFTAPKSEKLKSFLNMILEWDEPTPPTA